MKLEKVLFIPDSHHPYVDKKAWALMLRAARVFKPDQVVIMGDFADFFSVSSHSKDPNRALKLKEEIDATKAALKQLKDLKAKKYVYVSGNHEDRLERYLQQKAPELYNIVSIPEILQLKSLGFEYVPYKQSYALGKLNITHDVGSAGRFAHYKALDSFQHDVLIGHVHRIGYAVEGNANGERHVTATFGWLGDINSVDYMHKIKATREWSLGFGIGYLDKSTNNVYVVPVPIVDNSVLIEGKLVK